MTAFEILVIVLASALALLLVLLIIATVFVIKILSTLKRIAQKAELVADKVEHISEFFEKTAGPAAIIKLFANVTDSIMQAKRRKK